MKIFSNGAHKVEEFVEKPDLKTAQTTRNYRSTKWYLSGWR